MYRINSKLRTIPYKSYLSSLVDKFGNDIATTAPSTLVPPHNVSGRVVDSTLSITTPHLEGGRE